MKPESVQLGLFADAAPPPQAEGSLYLALLPGESVKRQPD